MLKCTTLSLYLSLSLSAACCTSLSISIANLQLSWGIICARLSVVSSIDCGLRWPAAWCGAAPHTVPAPAAAARQPSRASQPVRYHVVYCGSFPAAAAAAAAALFEPFFLRLPTSRGSGLVSPRCCASFHRQQLRQHHHYPQVTRKKVN